MDAVEKYRARRDARIKKRMDDFKENDHPRDENGRFTSGGGGGKAAAKESKPKSKESIRMGGKDWDVDKLTELWKGRGYSEKKARERAEKDFKETKRAQENTRKTINEVLKSDRLKSLKDRYERDMSTTGKLSLSEDELYELSKDPKMRKKMHDDLVGDDGYNAKYWKEHPVSGGKYFGETADKVEKALEGKKGEDRKRMLRSLAYEVDGEKR